MVHKNYKWNISKEKGSNFIYNLIDKILLEKIDHSIEIEELLFLLNNRTKNIDFLNNNNKKNINNFIKTVFGSLTNFIDSYDHFVIKKIDTETFIKINPLEISEWIFVEE